MWQRRPLSRQCSGSGPTGNTGAAIKIYFDPRCQFVQAICNVSLAQLSLATRDASQTHLSSNESFLTYDVLTFCKHVKLTYFY